MKTYIVKTLGCKSNSCDSDAVKAALAAHGWVEHNENHGMSADICILNSCIVTEEADKQSTKAATRLARENPGARVFVTGCGAEVAAHVQTRVKSCEAVKVVSNRDKGKFIRAVTGEEQNGEPNAVISPVGNVLPSTRTRAFIKVQEGCNAFCTYCIIPYARGSSASVASEAILGQVSACVAAGINEIVLTATNLGAYGHEVARNLEELIAAILEHTDIKRIRLGSLAPLEITPGLVAIMKQEPRLCPHFHVSAQSTSSRILKLMKRRYGGRDIRECFDGIAAINALPGGAFVGMDIITGFPGESDGEFEKIVKDLEGLPWTRLHVFPYSERAGTPATRLSGVIPKNVRVERARELNRLSLARLEAHYANVLELCRRENRALDDVLVEKGTVNVSGYTRNYLRVFIAEAEHVNLHNRIVSVMPHDIVVDKVTNDVALNGSVIRHMRTSA